MSTSVQGYFSKESESSLRVVSEISQSCLKVISELSQSSLRVVSELFQTPIDDCRDLHSRISVTEFCYELCVLRMRELIPEPVTHLRSRAFDLSASAKSVLDPTTQT